MSEHLKIAAYDQDGILGIGDNADQALAEAEGFLRDHADNPDECLEKVKTAPVSDALLDEILRVGFPFDTFHVPVILGPDGILWLDDGPSSAEDEGILELSEDEVPF